MVLSAFVLSGPSIRFSVPEGVADAIYRFLTNVPDGTNVERDFVTEECELPAATLSSDIFETEGPDFEIFIPDRLQFETAVRCLNAMTSVRSISRAFVIFGESIGSMRIGKPNEAI